MFERNGVFLSMVACAASAGLLAFSAPAQADGAGWFLGGIPPRSSACPLHV